MTTVVAVRKGNYACIAADSLCCYGNIKESQKYIADSGKIDQITGDTFIAATGDASIGLVIRNYFRRPRVRASFGNSDEIFETFRRMHATLKDQFYLNPADREDDPFECSHMEAVIANPHGIFGLYALRSVMEYNRFFAMGSGHALALGAMYVAYDRFETAEEIAKIGVEAAAEFDDGTGLPVTFHTIRLKSSRK